MNLERDLLGKLFGDGGFTYLPQNTKKKHPTSGFAVATGELKITIKGKYACLPFEMVKAALITTQATFPGFEDYGLGGWWDEENQCWELGSTWVVPEEELDRALELGRMYRQRYIYNLGTRKEVAVG